MNMKPFGGSPPIGFMTAEWGVISQELMKRGILVTTGVKEKLLSLDDPMKVLNQASNVGFERGMLSVELLDKMIQEAMPKGSLCRKTSRINRTYHSTNQGTRTCSNSVQKQSPRLEERDFSGIATDVDNDILVHYDITGNSTTEGKMGHIQACFNDRLDSIRKMIVKNSRLPRKPQEIGRLNVEYRRYQGYENLAVAIGLVNEPRHTRTAISCLDLKMKREK